MDDWYKKKYVYLICDPANDLFKIGVTKNLYSKRMRQLQTGNGTELHVVTFHETFYPFRVEQLMHDRFASKRVHGEWFALENEDVVRFKSYCCECELMIEALKSNPFFAKQLR